jgi:hypothetical protein
LVGFDLHRPIGLSVPTEPTTYVGRTKFGGFSVSESTQGEVYRGLFTLRKICGFSAPFLKLARTICLYWIRILSIGKRTGYLLILRISILSLSDKKFSGVLVSLSRFRIWIRIQRAKANL